MTLEPKHQPATFRFDVSGIRNGRLQNLFVSRFREIAGSRPISCDFWSILQSGHLDTLPRNLIVMTDLSKVAGAYQRLDRHSWTRAVRERRLFFFVLVRTERDQRCAGLVDDLVRASDSRFSVWSLTSREEEAREDWVSRAIAAIDPHAIVDIRYSDLRKCFWIQFGDGLSSTLNLKELDLKATGSELLPETVTVSSDDSETVELLDIKGEKFEIDSRSLRALVDPTLAENLKREADEQFAKVSERLRRKRTGLKVSQQELARRTGLEQALISKLECGKHQPRFDTLRKYAEGLGLSIGDLLEA